MTAISDYIKERGVEEVLHFTSNHGLVGCLEERAVLSRRQLPEHKHLAYVAAPTATMRQEASEFFDKERDWLDYVNLSISEINFRYFNVASTRWHPEGRWWVLLSFRPEILDHDGVFFATTNNVYDLVERGEGIAALQKLFISPVARKLGWFAYRRSRPPHLPTCEQAEVLYPRSLSLNHLQRIYVRTDSEYDIVRGWVNLYGIPSVEVLIVPSKFSGQPN